MRLPANIQIHFPECPNPINHDTLTAFRSSPKDPGPYFWAQHHKYSDSVIFLTLLCHYLPLNLTAREPCPLILHADFNRFPYTIDEQTGFAAFAIRLMPAARNQTPTEFNHLAMITLPTNPTQPQLHTLQTTPDHLVADIDDLLRFEAFYFNYARCPIDPPLPPLTPPANYLPQRFTNHNLFEE